MVSKIFMTYQAYTLFFLFFAGFLLFPNTRVQAKVVVNEIAAYESSGCEWVELYNTGSEPINLDGWHFGEQNTNHGLSLSILSHKQDWVIEVGAYAIVTQNDGELFSGACGDYAVPVGLVLDSSWGTLNEIGEIISFKHPDNTVEEEFTYTAAPDFSLERKDANSMAYTVENWTEHPSSNTFGRQNDAAFGQTSVPVSPPPEVSVAPPAVDEPSPSLPKLVINEFFPDTSSGESEWVEIYNTSEYAGDISLWALFDGVNQIGSLRGTIEAHGFFVFSISGSKLNNAGDAILLLQPNGTVADRVSYGDWQDGEDTSTLDNAKAAGRGNTIARLFDGYDTGRDNGDFTETTQVTKGMPNVIVEPQSTEPTPPPLRVLAVPAEPVQPPAPAPTTTAPLVQQSTEATGAAVSKALVEPLLSLVLINEILPSPVGDDRTEEFVELFNPTDAPIDIGGASIDDDEVGSRPFVIPDGAHISPHGFLAFFSKQTGISFGNSGDMARFLSPDGHALREVAYGEAPEGAAYARNSDGTWEWTAEPTPDEENILAVVEAERKQVSTGNFSTAVGVVIVEPGVFGSQYFYIINDADGKSLQIYLHDKAFPALVIGDRVQVSGVLGEAYGEKRLNAKKGANIAVLGGGAVPAAESWALGDIDDEAVGLLVLVQGEVTEVKKSYFFLDDGTGEIKITIKKGTAIDMKNVSVGGRATVSGILSLAGDGTYQIFPRGAEDIAFEAPLAEKQENEEPRGIRTSAAVVGAGIGSFLLGTLGRLRGARIIAVGLSLFRKKKENL